MKTQPKWGAGGHRRNRWNRADDPSTRARAGLAQAKTEGSRVPRALSRSVRPSSPTLLREGPLHGCAGLHRLQCGTPTSTSGPGSPQRCHRPPDRFLIRPSRTKGVRCPAARRRELERLQSDATTLPDRVVLLDLPLRVAERRMQDRGGARAPTEHREVLRRASRAYRQLARKLGWIRVRRPDTGAEELLAELDLADPVVLRDATRERT